MNSYVDFSVLRNVFFVSLIAGIGVTALFAFGVRILDDTNQAAVRGPARNVRRSFALLLLTASATGAGVGVWAVLAK